MAANGRQNSSRSRGKSRSPPEWGRATPPRYWAPGPMSWSSAVAYSSSGAGFVLLQAVNPHQPSHGEQMVQAMAAEDPPASSRSTSSRALQRPGGINTVNPLHYFTIWKKRFCRAWSLKTAPGGQGDGLGARLPGHLAWSCTYAPPPALP